MPKHTYFAPARDSKLLIMSLKSYSDAVLVPKSPGYQKLVLQIVICVQFGYFFPGLTSQTTEVYHISLRRYFGMY